MEETNKEEQRRNIHGDIVFTNKKKEGGEIIPVHHYPPSTI